jgi:hypothetical protein
MPSRLLRMILVVLAVLAGLSQAGTTAAHASSSTYDASPPSRIECVDVAATISAPCQLTGPQEPNAWRFGTALGTVAIPGSAWNATEAGPSFYRGSRPGEAPSFEPRPNDFKVDAATGTVRPTHGVSVFDNPGSVTSKGFTPHEIDLTSVPPELRIIQRGKDPSHYEIVPRVGADLTPEQYKGLMCQIVCKPNG